MAGDGGGSREQMSVRDFKKWTLKTSERRGTKGRLLVGDQKQEKRRRAFLSAARLNFTGDNQERTANYRVVQYGGVGGPRGASKHVNRSHANSRKGN